MKLYIRKIKPMIRPPSYQGHHGRPQKIPEYDEWFDEECEDELRELIIPSPNETLVFKEKYVEFKEEKYGVNR